jgi:hypothetical protein
MFKPVPNAKGCIMSNISALSNTMEVDADSYAVLVAALGEGGVDHTYIRIGEAPLCEYIQVQQLNSGVAIINRGEDSTIPQAFPALTEYEYILTAAAIEDIVQESMSPPSLSINGISPIVVTQLGSNNFEISVPEPVFNSSGNTVDITGSFPNYDFNVVRGTNGCCD